MLRRLVEDAQRALLEQLHRERDLRALPARELRDALREQRAQLEVLDEPVRAALARPHAPVQRVVDREVLLHAQLRVEALRRREERTHVLRADLPAQLHAEQVHRAAAEAACAGEDLEQRRLPRRARAEHDEHAAVEEQPLDVQVALRELRDLEPEREPGRQVLLEQQPVRRPQRAPEHAVQTQPLQVALLEAQHAAQHVADDPVQQHGREHLHEVGAELLARHAPLRPARLLREQPRVGVHERLVAEHLQPGLLPALRPGNRHEEVEEEPQPGRRHDAVLRRVVAEQREERQVRAHEQRLQQVQPEQHGERLAVQLDDADDGRDEREHEAHPEERQLVRQVLVGRVHAVPLLVQRDLHLVHDHLHADQIREKIR